MDFIMVITDLGKEASPEDVIWGVGIAKQSSDQMSMTTAEARALRAVENKIREEYAQALSAYLSQLVPKK
jgi:hypothetical protein